MVRPISGNQQIRSGEVYRENEGVAVRATRGANGTAHTRGAQGAQSRPANGAVQDEVVRTPTTTQTPGQAAVAARQSEIRTNANALLQQADSTRPGPKINVPPPRRETFQGLVDRQHDHALHHGAVMTGGALLSSAAGGGVEHALEHSTRAAAIGLGSRGAQAAGVAVGGTTHGAYSAVVEHNSTSTAVRDAAIGAGAEAALGPAGAAMIVQAHALINQARDNNERIEFQQNASAYDANRTALAQQAQLAMDHGVLDGHLAAAGRRPINWEMYRTNGDYASGVRRGLAEGARDPSSVAHLTLQQPQPARTSIP